MAVAAWTPIGAHVLITDLSSAIEITPPAECNAVLMQATVSDVRFTLDGSDPTGTDRGFDLIADAQPYVVPYQQGRTRLRVIEVNLNGEINYQPIVMRNPQP